MNNKINSISKALSLLTFMFMLSVASTSAMAEWIKLGGSEMSSIYANSSITPAKGNKVITWQIMDFSSAQVASGQKFLSIKSRNEFDCKKKQGAVLQSTLYSGNMGKGYAFNTDTTPSKSSSITPETAEELSWNYACGNH